MDELGAVPPDTDPIVALREECDGGVGDGKDT